MFLVLNIIFSNVYYVYASSVTPSTRLEQFITELGNITSLQDGFNFVKKTLRFGGLILGDYSDFDNVTRLNELDQYITGRLEYDGIEEPTEQDKVNYIKDQYSKDGDNVVINDSFKTEILNIANNYVSQNYYITVNAFNLNENSNAVYWSDTTHLQAIKDLCSQYQNDYYLFYYGSSLYNQATQLIIGLNKDNYVFSQSKSGFTTLVEADMYYMAYGLTKSGDGIYGNPAPSDVLVWQYDKTNQVYISGEWNKVQITVYPSQFIFGKSNVYLGPASTMNAYWQNDTGNRTLRKGKFVSVGRQQAIIYKAYEIYAQYPNGVMPYYYNNTVWQDFSSSSGDYTFSPTNINTVTYGDVSEYIDNSYQDNDYYPDNSTVNNWIENTNEENITNNNGGGSGGDDSGGGSGSDDSIDIFGWLKQLGAVIGSLIKGLGEFLTEVLDGIVSALNTLLEGLSSIIETVTEAIPSVFMEFIKACFDWMPDEWIALLTASLLLMILWGIIKLIRGS